MRKKSIAVLLLAVILGTGILTQTANSDELTSGVEFEELTEENVFPDLEVPKNAVGETDEPQTEETPAEEVTMKESKVEDSKITGIENGGTYTVSADAPINVTIVGANSFGENPAQVGDTRWLFQSVSINGGTATAKWEWTGEDAPVYTISLVPSDSIRESGDYDITFYFIQEVLEPNKWSMTEADLGEVTLRVHLDVPQAYPTEVPVPTEAPILSVTPSPMPDYSVISQNGPDIILELGNTSDAILTLSVDRPLTFNIQDESVVSIEDTEYTESIEWNEYETILTLKGLNIGKTTVDFCDGDYVIYTFNVTVITQPSRPPKIVDINDTVITGITDLKLMPNTFYPFTVTGAGFDNYDPVPGDNRWVPAYWRMESGTTQQTTWRIGAKAGINETRTIPIRVYLQEQRYDGFEWKATGITDYISADVTTVPYYQEDVHDIITRDPINISLNYDRSSIYTGEEITASYLITGGSRFYEQIMYHWSEYYKGTWSAEANRYLMSSSGMISYTPSKASKIRLWMQATDSDGRSTIIYGPEVPIEEPVLDKKNGLVLDDDGKLRVYKEDQIATNYSGIVEYSGNKFFIAKGEMCSDASGLNLYDGKWYYLSNGQIQIQYTGLIQYDGEWFYITNGVLDSSKNGLVDYDGSKFLVSEGRIRYDVNGLWQNFDDSWYFLANGQVQTQHTGVDEYDGAFFFVRAGKLAADYNGMVDYDGSTFRVVGGQLY